MRRSNAGIWAIEFSFPSTLQLSTSALGEYFQQTIFAVLYVLSGLYTPRFKLLKFFTLIFAVFLLACLYLIVKNMFGDEDFIGISLKSSYTPDH
jgi:hypothetical protein